MLIDLKNVQKEFGYIDSLNSFLLVQERTKVKQVLVVVFYPQHQGLLTWCFMAVYVNFF